MPPPMREKSAIEEAPTAKEWSTVARCGSFGVDVVEEAEAEDRRRRDEEAHDRAAVERREQRVRLAALARRLAGADVRVGRGLHADEAGEEREERTEEEAAAREQAEPLALIVEREEEEREDRDRVDREDPVLPHQERHRAFADEARDHVHRVVALGQRLHAEVEEHRDHQADDAGDQRHGRQLSDQFTHLRIRPLCCVAPGHESGRSPFGARQSLANPMGFAGRVALPGHGARDRASVRHRRCLFVSGPSGASRTRKRVGPTRSRSASPLLGSRPCGRRPSSIGGAVGSLVRVRGAVESGRRVEPRNPCQGTPGRRRPARTVRGAARPRLELHRARDAPGARGRSIPGA